MVCDAVAVYGRGDFVLIAAAKRQQGDGFTRYWFFLGGVFVYLSMDEGAVIHEIVSEGLEAWLQTSGYLTFPWVIVFVPLAAVLGIAYVPFLRHLPGQTAKLMVAAGVIYVGGAAGVEMISANWYAAEGVTFPYLAIATVEELYEMLGVVVFIYALLAYIEMTGLTAVSTFLSIEEEGDGDVAAVEKRPRRRGVLAAVVGVVVVVNIGVASWAHGSAAEPELVEIENLLFYQTVSARYAEDGILVLGLGEMMGPDNPAAQPIAGSLLTLFDDVMVVTLPASQASIAFAGVSLPFDAETLAVILEESGEVEYVILDRAAVRGIADGVVASEPYP